MKKNILIIITIISMFVLQSLTAGAVSQQALFYNLVIGGDGADYPWSMEPLPDGGFIIVSTTQSFGSPHTGSYDGSLWLLMVNRNGTISQSMVVTPPDSSIYYDSALLPDNSIVAVGTTGDYSKAVITRVYLNGTVAFYLEVSPSSNAYAPHFTAVEYYNGLIYAVGAFYDLSLYRPIQWILVLDLNGNTVKSVGYDPGSPFYYPTPFTAAIADDTLYIAGYGYTNPSLLMAFNITTWNVVLAFKVGDSRGDDIYGMALAGDNIVLAGSTDDYGGEYAFVTMIDPNGTVVWGKAFGSIGIERFFGLYYDGSYVYASGWSQVNYTSYKNDTLIAKIDASTGNLEWYRIIGGEENDWAYRVYVDPFNYVYVIGGIGNATSSDDIIILKLPPNGIIPNCELLRNETLSVEDFDPPISPITPTFYDYTSSTSSTGVTAPVSDATPVVYTACSCVVGGSILTNNNNGIALVIPVVLVGLTALILLLRRRV